MGPPFGRMAVGTSLRGIIVHRAFGLDIPQTLEDVCDPTRLALVVYDMQVGIVNQIKNGQEITNKVSPGPGSGTGSGNSGFLHPAHVSAEGTDGSFAVANGYGLATGDFGQRGQAMVPAGRARLSLDSRNDAATQRGGIRQDHDVSF